MTNAPSGPSTGAGPYQTAHFIIVDNKFLMLRALLLFAVLGICPTAEAAQKLAAKAESGELELADGTQARASIACLLYTSPSPRDRTRTRMPSSA